jgi:nucleoid DNA-binding protein
LLVTQSEKTAIARHAEQRKRPLLAAQSSGNFRKEGQRFPLRSSKTMINKTKLTRGLRKTAPVSCREAALYVDYFLDTLVDGMTRGERIELRGFGSFEVKQVSAKTYRNLLSGAGGRTVPAHGRIVFRPCRKLRDTVWNTKKRTEK